VPRAEVVEAAGHDYGFHLGGINRRFSVPPFSADTAL
jgi:hypothetical protein